MRVIISEPVVRQLDFLIIVLSLEKERYPDVVLVGSIVHRPLLNDLPVHVKPAVPHFLALLVVRLHGRAQMVGHDGVCLAVLEQSQGHETLLLEEPCPEVLLVFFYLSLLIAPLTWCPLVQGHVVVPQPAGDANGILAQAPSEGVIGEQGIKGKISPSGRSDLLQRSVLVPDVFPSFLLAVPPFAGTLVFLYELSVPVIDKAPFPRLLQLSSSEVLAQLSVRVVKEVARLVRKTVLLPAIGIDRLLQMPGGAVLIGGAKAVLTYFICATVYLPL